MSVLIDRKLYVLGLCLKCLVLKVCRNPGLASCHTAGRRRLCRHSRLCRFGFLVLRIMCTNSRRRYRTVVLCPHIGRLAPLMAKCLDCDLLVSQSYCCRIRGIRCKTLAATIADPVLDVAVFRTGSVLSLNMTIISFEEMSECRCVNIRCLLNLCTGNFLVEVNIITYRIGRPTISESQEMVSVSVIVERIGSKRPASVTGSGTCVKRIVIIACSIAQVIIAIVKGKAVTAYASSCYPDNICGISQNVQFICFVNRSAQNVHGCIADPVSGSQQSYCMRAVLSSVLIDNNVALADLDCVRQNINRCIFHGLSYRFLLRRVHGIIQAVFLIRSGLLGDRSIVLRSVRTIAACILVLEGYRCRRSCGRPANGTGIVAICGRVTLAPLKTVKHPVVRAVSKLDRLLFKNIDAGSRGVCLETVVIVHIVGSGRSINATACQLARSLVYPVSGILTTVPVCSQIVTQAQERFGTRSGALVMIRKNSISAVDQTRIL